MSDRWTRWCRRLAAPSMRESAFDPAARDFEYARAASGGGLAGGLRRANLAARCLGAALETRRLAAGEWLGSTRDLRHAVRVLSRRPFFATTVVLTLGIGLGANVTVFEYADTLLLAPLPVPDAGAVVRVYGRAPQSSYDVVSYPDYRDLRDAVHGLTIAAHASTGARIGTGDSRDSAAVELVTGNYFPVLRLTPLAGRLLDPRDDAAEGANPIVVISEAFWRAHFGGSRSTIGSTLEIYGTPFQIVGVVHAPFRGTYRGYPVDVWTPLSMQQVVRPRGLSLDTRSWGWLSLIGRLAPGVSLDRAQADVTRAGAAIHQDAPPDRARTFVVTPAAAIPDRDRATLSRILIFAIVLSALLLTATCANLIGVFETRLIERRREFAIRQALGASASRLAAEWFAECVVLSLAGGGAGLAVAAGTSALLDAVKPPAAFIGDLTLRVSPDWRVVVFTAALSLLVAAIFGLLPLAGRRRTGALDALRESLTTLGGGARPARLRRAVVGVQVAAAVVLLVAAALLVRSVWSLGAVDPGFDPSNLALVHVDVRGARLDPAGAAAYQDRLAAAVAAVPGVERVAFAATVPLSLGQDRTGVKIPGVVPASGSPFLSIDYNVVSAAYFSTMQIPFVEGGPWTRPISTDVAPVVINEAMAKRYWPGRTPIGETLTLGSTPARVVGVVRDGVYYSLGEHGIAYLYLPAERDPGQAMTVIARTTSAVTPMLPAIERAVAAIDRRVAVSAPASFEDVRDVPLYSPRAFASTAGIFSALALILTSIGLYGVTAASVGQRTMEIGLRMALGARPSEVVGGLLREAARVVLAGVAVGLVGGYVVAGALGTWLFAVGRFDLPTYAAVVGVVCAIALVAAWWPARRAARIDPVRALRAG